MRTLRLGTPSLAAVGDDRPRTKRTFGRDILRSCRRSRLSNARCTRCEDASVRARKPATARTRR
jgi:hypothetical protein